MKGLAPILLSVALAMPLAAQTPEPGSLAAAHAALAAGRYDEVVRTVEGMATTGETLRLQLDAQLGLKQFSKALDAYDQIGDLERHPPANDALLAKIARDVLRDVAARRDPFTVVAACKALLARAANDPCAKQVWEQAKSSTLPVPFRLAALATLAGAGQAEARTQFLALARQQQGPAQRAVIAAAEDLPPADAVSVIVPALANPAPDVQYSAALALGDRPTAESRRALTAYLAGTPDRRAKSAAIMSLAFVGDDARMREILPSLPQLQGGDLLKFGEVLAAKGDGRGTEALERAAKDDRDLIRIAAAARLSASHPQLATPILKAGIESPNPITRAATLEEFRNSPLLTLGWARGFMLDQDPTVRIRACEALFTKLGAPPAARGDAPAARR